MSQPITEGKELSGQHYILLPYFCQFLSENLMISCKVCKIQLESESMSNSPVCYCTLFFFV